MAALAVTVLHLPKLIGELFDDHSIVSGEDGADHVSEQLRKLNQSQPDSH